MDGLWQTLRDLEADGGDCVVATVIEARGSVPADTGAKLVVTEAGGILGTVGGGKIEARALTLAEALLRDGADACRVERWNLQRDIGMTCGGEMTLLFEIHRALPAWRIVIFGAGHVVQALVPVPSSGFRDPVRMARTASRGPQPPENSGGALRGWRGGSGTRRLRAVDHPRSLV
jgi:xanthine/CO dehydrogenase XdhC/CoxF family maturation factor